MSTSENDPQGEQTAASQEASASENDDMIEEFDLDDIEVIESKVFG